MKSLQSWGKEEEGEGIKSVKLKSLFLIVINTLSELTFLLKYKSKVENKVLLSSGPLIFKILCEETCKNVHSIFDFYIIL